jgi:hypothetical protein
MDRPVAVEIGVSSKIKAQWRPQIDRRMLAVIWMAVMLNCGLGRIRRQLRETRELSSSSVQWGFVEYSASIVVQTSFFEGQRNTKCRKSSCS